MLAWLKGVWFVDWWTMTTTWDAKLWVVQSIVSKLAAYGAIAAWLLLGIFILRNAVPVIAFRIWHNSMTIDSSLYLPLSIVAAMAVCIVAMLRLAH